MLCQLFPELRYLVREQLGVVDRARLRGVCQLLWEDEPLEHILESLGPVLSSGLPHGYERSMRRRFERLVEEIRQASFPEDLPLPLLSMGPVLSHHSTKLTLRFSSKLEVTYIPSTAAFPLPMTGSHVYVLSKHAHLASVLHAYHPRLYQGSMTFDQVAQQIQMAGKNYYPNQVWERKSLDLAAPYIWRCETPNTGIIYYASTLAQVLAFDEDNTQCLLGAGVAAHIIDVQ